MFKYSLAPLIPNDAIDDIDYDLDVVTVNVNIAAPAQVFAFLLGHLVLAFVFGDSGIGNRFIENARFPSDDVDEP